MVINKIRIISGIDPFTLSLASARHGQSNNPAALPCPLPPIDSTDLLSYLVLQTFYITTRQFKARTNPSRCTTSSLVAGYAISQPELINGKCEITGRVKCPYCNRHD